MMIKLDDKRIFNHCPDEKYVTRMLTCDLFAVANLLSSIEAADHSSSTGKFNVIDIRSLLYCNNLCIFSLNSQFL